MAKSHNANVQKMSSIMSNQRNQRILNTYAHVKSAWDSKMLDNLVKWIV